jgi:RNA polymerase sigma-70 factor (ECF subfamily)
MRFDDLVRAHAADLFRYAFWLTREPRQAEDVVQEALLRSWRAFPQLRDAGAAKAWLFSIVRNEFCRSVAKNGPPLENVDDLELADESASQTGLEMREALMSLPPSYAEPLTLQVLGGFSCAEIAAALGISEGAAMTRLTRARQALKRAIGADNAKEGRGAGL